MLFRSEEIEEKDVDAREHAHEPALHDQQEHQVYLQALGLGLDRVEPRGEADDARHHVRRVRERSDRRRRVCGDQRRRSWTGIARRGKRLRSAIFCIP